MPTAITESLTIGSFLLMSTDGTNYKKVEDIVSYPDMGGAPEQVDVTNLSDARMRNILGLQSASVLEFPIALRADKFAVIKAHEATKATYHFALVFGGTIDAAEHITPTGSLGVIKWDGQISAWVTGNGVNEKRAATVAVSVSSAMPFYQTATAAGITIVDDYITAPASN